MRNDTINQEAIDLGIEETSVFTIKSTGKAFMALINGIYSDKILAPVRELMTNAYDAHIAAGMTDIPFDLHVPTRYRLEFAVRDYGVGMDHDQVMNSYSTLFDSSKDESNDEVGMLGLGSKSPFAYTMAFTLTCYDGTIRRTYSAHLNGDIPQIALMDTSVSDEQRGTKVSFIVQESDRSDFVAAAKRCLIGFPLEPVMVGEVVDARKVLYQFEDLTVYERSGWGTNESLKEINVRMGCVVYPIANVTGSTMKGVHVGTHEAIVIDIPIGTTGITTNREALSSDTQSVANVNKYLDAAFAGFKSEVRTEYDAATTDLGRAKAIVKIPMSFRKAVGVEEHPKLSLVSGGAPLEMEKEAYYRLPGNYVMSWGRSKTWGVVHTFDYIDIKRHHFVRDAKVPRRIQRIKAWSKVSYRFVIPSDGGMTERRLIKEIGVDPSQIMDFEDAIHDPGPPQRGPGAGASRSKHSEIKEGLKTKPWMIRMRNNFDTTPYSEGGIKQFRGLGGLVGVFGQEVLGLTVDEATKSRFRYLKDKDKAEVLKDSVQFLTEAQAAKLEPDPARSVGAVLRAYYDDQGYEDIIREVNVARQVRIQLRDMFISYDAADGVLEAEGMAFTVPAIVGNASLVVSGDGYCEYPEAPEEAVSLAVTRITSKYPSLVAMSDTEITNYIKENSDATTTTTTT